MTAVCPTCGVAVVPGYVRCPKCHAGLPQGAGRTKRTTADPGGTSLEKRRFPMSALLVALAVAAAVIVVFGTRGSGKKTEAAPPPPSEPIEARPNPTARAATAAAAQPPVPASEVIAADPRGAVAQLEDALHRQRLWGRVEIKGPRVDLRSGSCSDPAMRPAIEAKKTLLHDAGLTKLRCLEQSGAVVFERDL